MPNVIMKVAAIFLYFVAFSSARKFPDFVDALTQLQSLNNDWKALEWVWSASYDQEWLQSIVRNDSLQQFSASGMSLQCLLDLGIWAEDLIRRENWAIQSQWN